MKWETVKLVDICEVCGGTTPKTNIKEYWNGTNIWLSPVDLPEVGSITMVETSERKITDLGIKESGLRVLPVGSLVFSTRASIGKIGIVKNPLTTNQGFTNLIPSDRVNVRYLAYALKKSIPDIEQLGNTTTFKEVSRTALKNFKIPLPPLHIQEQIADTLDKADALRRKDQELLQKYDQLAQAIFYDMFGDPVRNEKGWKYLTLEQISIVKGQYGSGASAIEFDPKKYRYVRITDISENGRLNNKPVSASENNSDYELQNGDLLFARTGATVGKTYLYKDDDGPCIYAGYLIRFRINREFAVPDYIFHFCKTKYYKNWVAAKQNVVAQPNIN